MIKDLSSQRELFVQLPNGRVSIDEMVIITVDIYLTRLQNLHPFLVVLTLYNIRITNVAQAGPVSRQTTAERV